MFFLLVTTLKSISRNPAKFLACTKMRGFMTLSKSHHTWSFGSSRKTSSEEASPNAKHSGMPQSIFLGFGVPTPSSNLI
jgi:hypothetical protein